MPFNVQPFEVAVSKGSQHVRTRVGLLAKRARCIGHLAKIGLTETFGQLGVPERAKSQPESIAYSACLYPSTVPDELVPEAV